ncbi:MAG: YvcK family protein [Candidatus Omnitrophica bacterium]|nr:YvcK family protein [Candidatus Omnitrophota bacterium]
MQVALDTGNRKKVINPAVNLPFDVNSDVVERIDDLDRANGKAGSASELSPIIFGPGSQFTSVLIHLMIPGMIKALAATKHTPRILMLNPIKDAETSGITDKEYFERVVSIIERLIERDMNFKEGEGDISTIFDFVVVNDKGKLKTDAAVIEQAQRESVKSWMNRGINRNKWREGLIEFPMEAIYKELKKKKNPIVVISGDLMEVVQRDGKSENSFTQKRLKAILETTQKFYRQNQGSLQELPRGILFVSDTHASLDGALRIIRAFPHDPFVIIGDVSDRGHNLFSLLRLADGLTTSDHELWAVAAALGGNRAMTTMYLRMAFNYENDDLLEDLGLGSIKKETLEFREKSLNSDAWKEYGKGKSSAQKVGQVFQYLFTKAHFEYYYNQIYGDMKGQPKLNGQKETIDELAEVFLYTLSPGKKLFSLPSEKIEKDLAVLFENGQLDQNGRLDQIKTTINTSLITDEKLNLFTQGEEEFLKHVEAKISEASKDKSKGPESLHSLIGHFLKAPLYRVIKAEPQIARTEDTKLIRWRDPKSEKSNLIIHVLPPMNKNMDFIDMLGNPIPEDSLKHYYDNLNEALATIRNRFINNQFDPNEEFFAGWSAEGKSEIKIPAHKWFLLLSDSANGPMMAREHRRIQKEYVNNKIEETNNIVYNLLYEDDVAGFKIRKSDKEKIIGRFKFDKDYFVRSQDGGFTLNARSHPKTVRLK